MSMEPIPTQVAALREGFQHQSRPIRKGVSTKRPNVRKSLLEHIAFASFRLERHAHLLLEEDLSVAPPDLDAVRRNYFLRVERERAEREKKRAEGKRTKT